MPTKTRSLQPTTAYPNRGSKRFIKTIVHMGLLTLTFLLGIPLVGASPTGVAEALTPCQMSENIGQANQWFNSSGRDTAAKLRRYVRAGLRTAQPEVGAWQIVYTWSGELFAQNQNQTSPVSATRMLVAPVSFGGTPVGILTYTPSDPNLTPRGLHTPTRQPTTSRTVPIQTTEDSSVKEPADSKQPVATNGNGQAYILPQVAKSLLEASSDAQSSLVYDQMIEGWFLLRDNIVTPLSNQARTVMTGSTRLSSLIWAIQSWWGVSHSAIIEEAPKASSWTSRILWATIGTVVLVALVTLIVILPVVHQRAKERDHLATSRSGTPDANAPDDVDYNDLPATTVGLFDLPGIPELPKPPVGQRSVSTQNSPAGIHTNFANSTDSNSVQTQEETP